MALRHLVALALGSLGFVTLWRLTAAQPKEEACSTGSCDADDPALLQKQARASMRQAVHAGRDFPLGAAAAESPDPPPGPAPPVPPGWEPCPGLFYGTPNTTFDKAPSPDAFVAALNELNLADVMDDVTKMMTDSQSCWPADFGDYVGLFTRLAWHAAGTFRNTDGVGGLTGGRQRFDPEASWEDNTNLDKARGLLWPIKEKYGDGLSWADLIALSATQAQWAGGMPFKEFCFGRLDDDDGAKSIPLGPSKIQEMEAPCTAPLNSEGVPINGMCQMYPNETALAPTTVGLIYVDPGGPMGVPDPVKSIDEIRIVFGKMGHDDKGTVALIGGGHAWGKCHGPCSKFEYEEPAGLPPDLAFAEGTYPYVGKCPNHDEGGVTGMGSATWTSGFEGPWTSTPTRWSNEYFTYLLDYEWEPWAGPGGNIQYRMKANPTDRRMRLVTDISLIKDPVYLEWVKVFASNLTALDEAYDFSWRNLITKGSDWSDTKKCVPYGTPPVAGWASPWMGQPPTSMLNTDPR